MTALRGWALAAGLAAGAALAPQALAAPVQLVAEIVLNGAATGAIAEFEHEGDSLRVPAASLAGLGLSLPAEGTVDLGRLPGVRFTVDERTQTVRIDAEPSAFTRNQIVGRPRAGGAYDRASWGALLDYGFYAVGESGGDSGVSGSVEARVFGPAGVFSSAFTAHASGGGGGDEDGVRRLGTALTLTDPERARRLVLGDYVTGGLSWTRPVRAGGISLATDFSIRPDIITQPLPEISGAAAAPSTVDLLVNGVRRLSAETGTGPFSITQAPVVDGQGRLSLVVRDQLGQETVQTFQYYGSGDLLRPGLRAYALEAGAVRRGLGTAHDTYRTTFASFVGRWGVSDDLTTEAHGVVAEGLAEAGAGVIGKIAEAAVVGAAVEVSGSERGGGARLHLTGRRQTERYSLYASGQESFGDHLDLAGAAGDPMIRRALTAGASVFDERLGSLSLNYNRHVRTDGTFDVLGVNWTRAVGRNATVYVNGFSSGRDWGSSGVTVGVSAPLGGRRYGGLEASRTAGRMAAAARVSQSAPVQGGWGWRAAAEAGSVSRLEGEVRHQGSYGDFGLGAATADSRTAVRAFGAGSMVWMGGAPRLSGRTGESFALVETGMPGVEVMIENRPAGRTGRDGRLLIEGLPAYALSRIAIRPESVPLQAHIEGTTASIRPPRGAGVSVALKVRTVSAALIRILLPDGSEVPVGARARLNGRDAGLVGYGGLAFVSDLQTKNTLEVTHATGRCLVDVPHVQQSDDLPEIGPLLCAPA